MDRLIVQGVIHDKSRMRSKTRRTIKPMLALDLSLVYTFRVIPQNSFCNVVTNDIPKSPRNGFDQAYEVKNSFMSEIYRTSTCIEDKEVLKSCTFDDTVKSNRNELPTASLVEVSNPSIVNKIVDKCHIESAVMIDKTEGVIKSYKPGDFGFISVIDGGQDAFFYANQLDMSTRYNLRNGDRVEFSMKENERGRQASNIKLIVN